ncbi:hypothetical protein BVV20_17510 [Xanthomonas oryzae pv. oryzae]|nr:hypothetical protein BVV20_17510 [Xanthomonas oryzae pv. oryzae]
MICSSEKRFFTSNLLGLGNWTPSRCATQTWGDVEFVGKHCSELIRAGRIGPVLTMAREQALLCHR